MLVELLLMLRLLLGEVLSAGAATVAFLLLLLLLDWELI
jgi:hypothetical protein